MTQPYPYPQQHHSRSGQPQRPYPSREVDEQTARIPRYRPAPVQAPPPPARNGFGITALVLAIIGLVFGLIPLTGFIALILGLLAILFGLLGLGRVRRRIASNKVMSIVGTVLGVVAATLGIWGIVIVFGAVDQLSRDMRDLSSAPIPQSAPAAGEAAAPTAAFGETVTFTSGVSITIQPPIPYEPTRYAAMDENAERAMRFSVTVVNGSTEALDYIPGILVSHGGVASTGVFDSSNGLVDPPMTSLLPGASTTFDAVFGVGGAVADVQVEWRDGFIGDPAIFVGSF